MRIRSSCGEGGQMKSTEEDESTLSVIHSHRRNFEFEPFFTEVMGEGRRSFKR